MLYKIIKNGPICFMESAQYVKLMIFSSSCNFRIWHENEVGRQSIPVKSQVSLLDLSGHGRTFAVCPAIVVDHLKVGVFLRNYHLNPSKATIL